MASPVLNPALKPIIKTIDFGEELGDSLTEMEFVDHYAMPRSILSTSPVAASDPDLARAIISRETRLKSLLQERRNSKIKQSVIKQETEL